MAVMIVCFGKKLEEAVMALLTGFSRVSALVETFFCTSKTLSIFTEELFEIFDRSNPFALGCEITTRERRNTH